MNPATFALVMLGFAVGAIVGFLLGTWFGYRVGSSTPDSDENQSP